MRENCYYSIGEDDDEPSRISNFIMEPLFHIEDEINGTRIFRMRNMYNVCRVIELKESELCSLSNFQQKVGSLGNYVWLAKIDKLNRVKEYCIQRPIRQNVSENSAGMRLKDSSLSVTEYFCRYIQYR